MGVLTIFDMTLIHLTSPTLTLTKPCSNPILFLSVGGELAGLWKPNNRKIPSMPPATSVMCSKDFRHRLIEHSDKTVEKVEAFYEKLPAYTERLRNIKARVCFLPVLCLFC